MPVDVLHRPGEREAPPIELAREAPFRLGDLAVAPALREVRAPDGRRQVLEPRVMQVLVALARAGGGIVSRDELIRTCWRGTIVGDDAINRAISLLRRVSQETGHTAFRIETVPRVGYRLVVSGPAADGSAVVADAAPKVPVRSQRPGWTAATVLFLFLVAALVLSPGAPSGPLYSVSLQRAPAAMEAGAFEDELLAALTGADVPTAGGQARLALTGTLARRDGGAQLHFRLSDPNGEEVLWSHTSRLASLRPADLSRALASVAAMTRCALAFANDAGAALPPAVLAELARACELMIGRAPGEGLKVARRLTRQAPEFAGGWFALTHHAHALSLRRPGEERAVRAEALAAAEKLIALRPNAQEGYAYKALALDPRRPLARERLLRRAATAEPIFVDVGRAYLGDFLLQAGRWEEAFALHRAAGQQHPDSALAETRVFFAAAATGRWPIVDEALDRVSRLDPASMPGLLWRRAIWAGNWAAAERQVPLEHPAQEQAAIALYRALASQDEAGPRVATRLLAAVPEACCAGLRIELLTQAGRHAEALALLDGYTAGRHPGGQPGHIGLFLWDPALRPLWHDPALEPFLHRNGWIAYWRASRTRPDLCAQPQPPGFCRLLSD